MEVPDQNHVFSVVLELGEAHNYVQIAVERNTGSLRDIMTKKDTSTGKPPIKTETDYLTRFQNNDLDK